MAYAVAKVHDVPLLLQGHRLLPDRHQARAAVTPKLDTFRRIVVKIGSSLLVDRRGLKHDWLDALGADLAALAAGRRDLLVVSSGAIALGRRVLDLPRGPLKLEESQAAAAIGQIALARAWSETLQRHGFTAGQILLTLGDTEERRRYLNARSTIATLLKLGAIPVINENDTVATSEIRYGDNDRLAARVATMMGADLLVLLSDVDGLYSAPPATEPGRPLPAAGREDHAGDRGDGRQRRLGAVAGRHADQDRGRQDRDRGGHHDADRPGPRTATRSAASPKAPAAPGSWPRPSPVTGWKKWISGSVETRGALPVDDGAVKALRGGKSLLPAGVRGVKGRFQRGDTVAILGPARRGDRPRPRRL